MLDGARIKNIGTVTTDPSSRQ